VVYNMMRLTDYLFRWTGQVEYADYIERNLYNGILAQQHPVTGMVAYFLPLQAGARKVWGSPTKKPAEFTLRLRLPWWLRGKATLLVNGAEEPIEFRPSTFVSLRRTWKGDNLRLVLPKGLTVCPLPDRPDTVAFMDGPVVLAGLTAEERMLYGDKEKPETMLVPDNEREWRTWRLGYRSVGQDHNIRFLPLNEVTDQTYTVYFPIQPSTR